MTSDTDTGLWQATAYSNWITTAYQFGDVAFVPAPDFHNNVTVLQLQDSVKVGTDHTLRATVEYRHNTEGTTTDRRRGRLL